METLPVWSTLFCLSGGGHTWRPDDHLANKIKKTIKGVDINGYFEIMTDDSKTHRFNNSTKTNFLPILYETLADRLKSQISVASQIVPIPNKSAIFGNNEHYRTLIHARAIAAYIPELITVCDTFRWREPAVQSHQGGDRNPKVHFKNLRIIKTPTKPVILFDDFITTGGQMIACGRKLVAAGCELSFGVVFGRHVWEQVPDVVKWESREVVLSENPLRWQF